MDRLIIASTQKQLESFYKCKFSEYIKIYNGFQGRKFPVITSSEALDVDFFDWGFYNSKIRKKYYTINTKNIIHDKRFQHNIRNKKCILPVNCFTIYCNGKRLLIYNEDSRIFSLAAIYTQNKDSENKRRHNFAVLMVAAGNFFRSLDQSEEPLVISDYDQRKWLDNKLHHATTIINSYKGIKYNGYPIGRDMEDVSLNDRNLLLPAGPRLKSEAVKNDDFIIKKRTH